MKRQALCLLLCSLSMHAAVRYLPAKKLWILETQRTTYALGVNQKNELQNVYWGGRITRDDDVPAARLPGSFAFESPEGIQNEEYPAWGGMRYAEPCVKITQANGNRDVVLNYVSHQINGEDLRITVKDIQTDLMVDLEYRVYPANDVIRKRAVIRNQTAENAVVESAQSGVWYMPPGDGYRLSYLAGRWAGETQLHREPLGPGKKILESRRGETSNQANPWFAVDEQGKASEELGRVWFGALGWSGNWKIVVEQTPQQQLRVTGGFNDFDFGYLLKPRESLATAEFYAGYTDQGFGEASRIMHRFEREQILPDRAQPKLRPVLYNSWEATLFAVNEKGQTELAEKAAKIGVELFVMDDGWFGARKDDHAGLGDWVVNKEKFPNGLGGLIKTVNGLGMKFGLWVEPEMVNPNSDLFRAHPDWAIQMTGRPRTEGRNQLILNMARNDVKEHIFNLLDRLLAENHIEFLKWDMNRHITEPGWVEAPVAEQKQIYVKYVRNVYEIIDRLRAKHPGVEIESCSGGGGRVDLGILQRVDQVWTSDNTEAFDRLRIQEGFSMAYTPKVMMAWVTDVPNMNGRSVSLKYRLLSAMQGSVGIGANLNHWKDEDFQLAKTYVEHYKKIRGMVQTGNLYRLASPREGEVTANEYVSLDGKQAALFVFRQSQQMRRELPPLTLRGLDPKAVYRVTMVDDKVVGRPQVLSGSYLMNRGLTFRLTGDFDSSAVWLERQ